MPIYTTVLSASQTITGSQCAIDIGGVVTAQGFGNRDSLNADTSIPEEYNFVLYGPITVAAGTRLEVTGNAKIKNLDEV